MPSDDDFVGDGYPEEEVVFDAFSSEEDVNAPEYPSEGMFHLMVGPVDASGKRFPGAVFMSFEVLAGNVDGQVGKSVRHVVWPPSENAKNPANAKKQWQKIILCLMLALGMRKRGEFPSFKISEDWWNSLEGKQFIGRISHKEKMIKSDDGRAERKFTEAGIARKDDFFSVYDEEVSEVPKDEDALVAGGYITGGTDEGI